MDLPFTCPRFKSQFLTRNGCEKNQERARTLVEKGMKYIGPLQQCVECQGKDLKEETMRMPLGTPASKPATETKSCKNHPGTPQHKNSGFCLECLRERATRNSKNRKDRKLAEQPKGEAQSMATPVNLTEKEADKLGFLHLTKKDEDICEKHGLPIKYNSKGVSMGGCEQCRREISRAGGSAASLESQLFSGYPEILEYLKREAKDSVRTVKEQIVWCCKKVMQVKGGEVYAKTDLTNLKLGS